MGQADLAKLLATLPKTEDDRALVGYESSDDAAVFRLGPAGDPDAETLLSTLDFFTPVVDSPRDFGRIAAANALSDVYAMGGEPLFALNIVGFPVRALPLEVLGEILRGGGETAREAGIPVLGGHTTDFDVPVFGMAVTGRVRASAVRRNVGARAGDLLVLTKPLGSGVLTSALRARALSAGSALGFLRRAPAVSPEEEAGAIETMARLNRAAARAAGGLDVSATTDVTGFGLLGHLHEMLAGSGVAALVRWPDVPLLPGAARLAAADVAPDGSRRNLASARAYLEADGVREEDLLVLADAQTSGGLLVALSAGDAPRYVAACREGGDTRTTVVGRVVRGEPGRIRVEG